MPVAWWEYYANRQRPDSSLDFGVLASDPYDDAIIDQIVCILREAAQTARFSEYETVEFALSFVQGIEYVQDKVGTGYDEWPKYPLETLVDQGGDCEDSAIFAAALLNAMGYDAVLLVFPQTRDPDVGHAAVGVYSESIPGGTYWEYNGRQYYYLETTNSGWKLGELPDLVNDQTAHVLSTRSRAILAGLTFDAPTVDRGAYRFEVTVANVGSAPVQNLTIWGGWDAGNDRAWSGVTWNEGATLEPDEDITVSFWLEPPPRGIWTKSTFTAWGSNAVRIDAASERFRT